MTPGTTPLRVMSSTLAVMGNRHDDPDERPATWENVAVGEAKELVGHVIGDDEMAEEGEEQVEIAHEVRAEHEEKEKEDEA